jgi:hypothetical protein
MNSEEDWNVAELYRDWEWHGEEWISFYSATVSIQNRLELSTGRAQLTLRALCASGDVRSILYEIDEIASEDQGKLIPVDEPIEIKPSVWLGDQVDLAGHCVDVSEDDLRFWLDKQKPASSSNENKPALGKVPRIQTWLAKWYPNSVPEPAHCPRKELQDRLLKADPGLKPLDPKTLKTAIDEYNAGKR